MAKRTKLALADLIADPVRFQVRRAGYAETIAANIAKVGWIDAKAGEFHVWPGRRKDKGRYYILDGFSRYEGIQRLNGAGPAKVRCVVHDVTEREAKRLSREFNVSRRELTASERARAYRDALDEDIEEHPVKKGEHRFHEQGHRYERIARHFSGLTRQEIERDLPMAWLGEHAAYLVDNDLLPTSAARALGRFIRRTGITSQQGDEMASAYLKSDWTAHQFGAFLSEAEGEVEVAKQEDMFGAFVERKVGETKRLIRDLKRAKKELRMLEMRAEVFSALDDTVWRASRQQQKLLAADTEKLKQVRDAISSKSKRLALARMLKGR